MTGAAPPTHQRETLRAVLSVGSNQGDSLATLRAVPSALEAAGVRVVGASTVWQTPPWGPVAQDDFLNAIVLIETELSPRELLAAGATVEQSAGRERAVRWGPRTLDVDIITATAADGVVHSADPVLTLPHPRAAVRAFVLVPWLQVQPDAQLWHDGALRPVAELVAALPADEVAAVRRLEVGIVGGQ